MIDRFNEAASQDAIEALRRENRDLRREHGALLRRALVVLVLSWIVIPIAVGGFAWWVHRQTPVHCPHYNCVEQLLYREADGGMVLRHCEVTAAPGGRRASEETMSIEVVYKIPLDHFPCWAPLGWALCLSAEPIGTHVLIKATRTPAQFPCSNCPAVIDEVEHIAYAGLCATCWETAR